MLLVAVSITHNNWLFVDDACCKVTGANASFGDWKTTHLRLLDATHWVYKWYGNFQKSCRLGGCVLLDQRLVWYTFKCSFFRWRVYKYLHLWEIWHIWHVPSLHFENEDWNALFNLRGVGVMRHLLRTPSLRNEKRHINHSWQLRYNSFGVEWMYLEKFSILQGSGARCLYSAYEHHADVYGLQSQCFSGYRSWSSGFDSRWATSINQQLS